MINSKKAEDTGFNYFILYILLAIIGLLIAFAIIANQSGGFSDFLKVFK